MTTAFLIGVGVMCAMVLVMTIVILVCDATIANYGQVKIVINGEKEITVEGGRPLLTTLKEQQIFIPSACGGRGSCGMCKVKVLDGAGEALATELPWLNAQERKDRVRLSCQVKVKKLMRIEIPPELFKVRQFKAKVAGLRDLTYDIKEVTLQLPKGEALEFKAGQFVQIEVPPYELTDEPVYRAYSVASSPSAKDRVELEIRLVPNGICTTYVHKYLKTGDELVINGPYGDFYLNESDREMICVAGGSGMAPMKSILLKLAEQGSTRRIRYFFGARTARDLFLVDEMRELEKKLPNFTFIPALSAPEDGDEWAGEQGRVTEVVDRQVTSVEHAEAYLCGSPGLIDASVAVLRKKGLPVERIYYDNFG
jgi:Na+-transporting NADH:ubiquinone oxidoreductase subunit F